MLVDFSGNSCVGGWTMLQMMFQHMSEWKEIFLALNTTIAGQVVVSLECPEPQEHLAAISVGACRMFSNMVLLGHFAAQQGDYTFSLEITPAIHHSKVLKTTECNYWKSIIVTVLNNTPLIQPGQKKVFIRAHILLSILSCCSSMASSSEMKLQKHLWHLLVLVFYVFWFRLKLYLIWPWNNFQKWSFFSSSFDFVIFASLSLFSITSCELVNFAIYSFTILWTG